MSVNYRHSPVNYDMLPMIRYCILPGTVRYGTVLTYSHSLKAKVQLDGGGVMLLIHKDISHMPITELENDSESVWVKVFANKTSHFVASVKVLIL